MWNPTSWVSGPVPATQKIFQRNRLQAADVDAFEINEAFAIQVLASMEQLEIPPERVNAWGGALALGHPLGASGLRLMMTLHHRLHQLGESGGLGNRNALRRWRSRTLVTCPLHRLS